LKRKIGMFGGTFNPIHNAHISIAESFVNNLELDICYFVPAYQSPFRLNEIYVISPSNRLQMVEIALRDYPLFSVLHYEIEKATTSYTIDTINHLKSLYPLDDLFLLIGGDQAESFILWKQYLDILSNVQLCIAKRPDFKLDDDIISTLSIGNKKPIIVQTKQFEISASKIRQSIKIGKDISELIPKEINEFVISKNLYK
jgi:nicotinate-nucleotide adenylyltransferase